MELGPETVSGEPEQTVTTPDPPALRQHSPIRGAAQWLRSTNQSPGLIAAVRRARRGLPGDPDFGDPLSTAGHGGPRAAARAAGRLLGERGGASREVSLGALQVWQALTEAVSRRPANEEVTIVFTDLVEFSNWSLRAGDDATLKLLRRVARAIEPPLLDAGGQIVKRMGAGTMAVFADPRVAVAAVLEAKRALMSVDIDGYTARMPVGIHTGRPQRLAADWLRVDVNVAARVAQAAKGDELLVTGMIREVLNESRFHVKRKLRFRAKGAPKDLEVYSVTRA